MSAVTALINVMGRITILLMQQSFIVMMALGKALGTLISGLLARRQAEPPPHIRVHRRRQRRRSF